MQCSLPVRQTSVLGEDALAQVAAVPQWVQFTRKDALGPLFRMIPDLGGGEYNATDRQTDSRRLVHRHLRRESRMARQLLTAPGWMETWE